jgi:hypothetical protein
MDNKLILKEKAQAELYPNIFSDEYLASLNQDYGNMNLNSNENEDEFLSSLNTELNMNYFPESKKNNSEGSSMFSNSKVMLIK